ncbi:hypothetical protein ACG02S_00975 [Roseateles sp. DC23W]|uniref:MotA/TolQ/ExbB proton channel domain-containing protein n=1 Tax=Pelomonas dachongensis TaxID=3299029 RepID=A0ABW7EIG1_9BURK
MADSEKTGGGAVDVVKKAGEAVERLSDFTFALHVLPAFLALDIGLRLAHGTNIVTTDWSLLSKESLGLGLCVIVTYVVAMAIGVPVARAVVEPILRKALEWRKALSDALFEAIASLWRTEHYTPPREQHYESRVSGSSVVLRVARDRALRDKDSFWMAQVQQKEAQQEAARRAEQSLAVLSFAAVALALIDVLLVPGQSILGLAAQQVNDAVNEKFDGVGTLLMGGLVFAAGVPWIAEAFSDRPTTAWIEHPALAAELMAEFHKRQAELRPMLPPPWRDR